MTAIRDQLVNLLDEAARSKLTLREALAFLWRHTEGRAAGRGRARSPTSRVRDLEDFDFSAQPSIDPGQIRDLAACRWVAHRDAMLLLEAIRAVSLPSATALVVTSPLVKTHAEGRLEERLAFYVKARLLGYLPVSSPPVVATAILDRLLHRSHVVIIRGDSDRLREKRRSGLVKLAKPEVGNNPAI